MTEVGDDEHLCGNCMDNQRSGSAGEERSATLTEDDIERIRVYGLTAEEIRTNEECMARHRMSYREFRTSDTPAELAQVQLT